jgi:phytoene dehydrogenase-like protein
MAGNTTFDAIVSAGGHNGLVAAATLGRQGKRVCLLERSDVLGGMAAGHVMAGDMAVPRLAHLLYNLGPEVMRDLGLGGKIPLKSVVLPSVSLSPEGDHVVVRGGQVTYGDGRAHPEAAVFADIFTRLQKFAKILGRLSKKPPPELSGGLSDLATLGELAGLAKLGLDLKRLGKKDMREFLRVLLSNMYDLLLDDLADGPLAGLLAADAVRGAYAGPRSPGTVFTLMYRLGNGGDARLPLGGMGAVSAAFAQAAQAQGVEIRHGAEVAGIVVEEDRVVGVRLNDGAVLSAPVVLSNAGPMATMQMAGVQHFDTEAARRLRNHRCKGTVAKVNLILKDVPEFTGLSRELSAGRLVIAPSATYVERAFNPAKYGEMPVAPSIELVLPGLSDPALVKGGRHVLSAIVHFVPSAPKGGWTKAKRTALLKTTLGVLEHYAPGLSGLVVEHEVLTPADIEALTGAPGGHWHHGEMGIDQILTLRPANGMAQYRFGPGGLYLCGASAHPGGDVSGLPGRNSARQALKDGGL